MKKRILGFLLAFSLAFGICGLETVHAEGIDFNSDVISAEEKQFDTEYSVTWAENLEQCWNKVVLKESGILGVDFTKPESEILGIVGINVCIFDESENCITMVKEEDDEKNTGSMHIGLDQGTYYIMLTSDYVGSVYNQMTSYKFSFTGNAYCEKEPNNTKEDAVPMKVDTAYTGYLGGGFSNLSDNDDERDVYEVELKKDHVYKYTYDKVIDTTIVELLGENTDFDEFINSVEADDFCVEAGTTFIAPYSGSYYVKIYNYGNEQYQYTVKISDVTPKATNFTTVKAGNDAFTAKWKKTACSGYQIQYSTSKNFKNASTVKVSSSKASTTVKKLASNKKYYVRIRTYKTVGDKVAYSPWSKAKTVTTK